MNKLKETPLEYGIMACKTMMRCYMPQDLPPEGALFYIQGVFLDGMQRIWRLNHDAELIKYVKDYVDSVIAPDGSLYGINHDLPLPEGFGYQLRALTMLDCKQPSVLFYDLYDEYGEEKYIKAAKTIAESMYYYPINRYGGYWHMMTQPYQMWLDGAYMAGPFSVKYSRRFGDNTLMERAIKQIFLMEEHMKDEKTGLYYHGWDDSKKERWADPETGLSGQFWGRAVGWFALAIVDIMELIPKNHPAMERLAKIERELLTTLAKYQDEESGLWYQVLDKPEAEGNWLETSCSCLFAYAYAKAIRMGILDEEYTEVLDRTCAGIDKIMYVDEEGELIIPNICLGACIEDGSYEYYINRPKGSNDLHGIGVFLILCSELERNKKNSD